MGTRLQGPSTSKCSLNVVDHEVVLEKCSGKMFGENVQGKRSGESSGESSDCTSRIFFSFRRDQVLKLTRLIAP